MMKTQQYSLFTRRRLVRFIALIVFILFLIIACSFFYVYSTAMKGKETTFKQSRQIALQETPIKQIEKMVRYNGENTYDVAIGTTDEESRGMAFVPTGDDVETTYVDIKDGMSKEEMSSDWKKQCQDCKLVSITPGIEDGHVIWEIVYENTENQYVFETYLFENGDLYEQVKLRNHKEEELS
ncbi:Uncharacterized protein YpmB [Salinibacillus kushneri]|uniref:Uncharacterized protein YpmB n=2 Tax=Salinibacillus kushneri TaxID=237682 RepID=A0A1I0I507_9BACI|nr:Uncharacterized protein YpmB [Salinibacillus kushneri]